MKQDGLTRREVLRRAWPIILANATVPLLGVCLGMQGLVSAYGGRVDPVEPAHGDDVLGERLAGGLT